MIFVKCSNFAYCLFYSAHAELMIQVADFLAMHFADSRIVNPAAKDTLVQALAGFVTTSGTLKCLESIGQAR